MSEHEVRFPAGTFTQEEARAYVVADRLVAAAVEEVRERYAPLVEAARAMVKSSFLLDAEEQALAAALADLGEGQ